MATATQTPSMLTCQASSEKVVAAAALTGNYSPEDDPTLTASQRQNRPLSIISETEMDSGAAASAKGNNSGANHGSLHRTSSSKSGQNSAVPSSAQAGQGKGISRSRISSTSTRCSPTIRKLTENFERSPASSPSRAGGKVSPRPASTGTIGIRNGKTNSTGSSGNSSSNSANSTGGSGTIVPRTSSPRTVVNKSGPPSVMKTHRPSPSSSPVSKAVSQSTASTRTSSPSQISRTASGKKTLQEQEDIMSRLTSGKTALPSKAETKKLLISSVKTPDKAPSSNISMKNNKSLPKSEKLHKVAPHVNDLESEESHPGLSPNGGNESNRDCEESCETSSDALKSKKDTTQKPKDPGIVSLSPLLQRKGSLSPGGDANSIPRDGGGLARIRETAERLKLTSPSSPLSNSPAHSPKFAHRVRLGPHQASTPLKLISAGSQSPPVSRGVAKQAHTSLCVPNITVTNTDGNVRGPPPQLGPSAHTNVLSTQTPYSQVSPPLTTISESSDPNFAVSNSEENEINNGQAGCHKQGHGTENKASDTPVSNKVIEDVSNNNFKTAIPYNHVNTNLNHNKNFNTAENNNRICHPKSTFLLGSRLNTSTHSQTSTALLPYYKLSSSGFFARRLSSGGSSICEEKEEEEVESHEGGSEINKAENKPKDIDSQSEKKECERSGGDGVKTLSSTSSSSSVLLLSERGSSVSSLGSTTSINSSNSVEPTSPPLPQPLCAQQHQITASHLTQLKETADKLRLSTRRDSTMAWRQKYLESSGHMRSVSVANGGLATLDDGKLTQDRKQRIDAALDWLREELQDMRTQDQNLARQLLTIRHDIHQLKLQRSTEEHQELIDDYWNELEELQEFSDVLDLPQPVYGGDNPLRNVGVTRLNLSARRFSAC